MDSRIHFIGVAVRIFGGQFSLARYLGNTARFKFKFMDSQGSFGLDRDGSWIRIGMGVPGSKGAKLAGLFWAEGRKGN